MSFEDLVESITPSVSSHAEWREHGGGGGGGGIVDSQMGVLLEHTLRLGKWCELARTRGTRNTGAAA